MFGKGSKLYSIFKSKCPRCHEGEFFKYRISFNPKKITTLHENCPKCNLKYMMEPSFFFGAMYVNYAIAVALFVGIFIIAKVFIGLSILKSFISIVVVSLLLTPINLRLSRIIWINLFVSYNKKAKELQSEK
ncbi:MULTISPECIES: DUF983 domain-containing protein [unclassified Tenacibaculum]|uniref:DUF983 domain-containing protein n=1 Tax=unclassified Tenacibaculum TaxID=2635139 RepID=UPI001F3465A7|nr:MULTISPECIES: DUF983 domain-containing protein [unclassified Tenacibaculum]MCF2873538.1 DUF983 domain-containing protein [Tenacibaculum sp. Cn5-1]MCF2933694.1 DUF983 domain-containing protein [Tenacibaculum sp. Cn5-34]MCG7509724.1 DUF983 domain-containing protein [Tenacibaculum sp. Cn5-46]